MTALISRSSHSAGTFPLLQELEFVAHSNLPRVSFHDRMQELKGLRDQALQQSSNKASVVISGGGPAGLIRGICALINGNPTTIIEKRAELDNGRENTVALDKESLNVLCFYGVHQYLDENKLILPFNGEYLPVRLKDLERAMKVVIAELTSVPIIQYDSQVEQINDADVQSSQNAKINLIYKSAVGQKTQLDAIDVLVVAEGAHSYTNEHLLHNHRIAVLPLVPVISAIYKDDRPSISGLSTFLQYIGKTLASTATSVYYYTIFTFKFIFQGENFFNLQRRLAGSLILKTPGQNYLGVGLSREESDKMMQLCQVLEDAKAALEEARNQNTSSPDRLTQLQKNVDDAQKNQDSYLRYWTGLAFCFANVLNVFRFIYGETPLHLASRLPLDHVSVTKIGADRSSAYSGTIGRTSYLIAGDTLATVDPTTGLGCTTAIKTVIDFNDFINGLDKNMDPHFLHTVYSDSSAQRIRQNHDQSLSKRRLFRPDAVSCEE